MPATDAIGSTATAPATFGTVGARPAAPASTPEPAPTSAPNRRLTDIVNLSPEAIRVMDAHAVTLTIPESKGSASPELDLGFARHEYVLKQGEYRGKAMELLRQTLGLSDDQPFMLGGAANALLDEVASRNGLEKPEMPAALRESGMKDPFEEDAKAESGVIGIGMPGSGKEVQIAFDRRAISSLASGSKLLAVPLNAANDQTGPLIGAIKESSLGRFTDVRSKDQNGKGASLWAVTDGRTDPNARLFATIRSVGMDDTAADTASSVLKALKRLYSPA
ncbi:hypothetical protein [Azospirillum sp. sgz302134]